MRASAPQNVYHVNDGAEVIAFHRWTGSGDDLVVVASLSDDDFGSYELGFPLGGEWFEVLNGSAAAYGGDNTGNGGRIVAGGPGRDGLDHSASIVVPRRGVLVFAREPLPPPDETGFLRADCNGDGSVDVSDPVFALAALFAGGDGGNCPWACDANADDELNVSDPVYTLNFLFAGGAAISAPWPDCGTPGPGDESALGCERRCD